MILTKSLFLTSLNCPRQLWLSANNKQVFPKHSIMDEHKFKQGYAFQEQVYNLFPDDSILLGNCSQEQNLVRTQDALSSRKVLFEAGFLFDDVFVRSDVLIPNGDGSWDLIEIKASTKQKKEHIPDLAIQLFVLEKSGLKINKCFVYHLNKEYVRQGDLIPKELVDITEVTEEVKSYDINLSQDNTSIEKLIKEAKEIISLKEAPEIHMGSFCGNCSLKSTCSKEHLPEHSVLELSNWRTYWKLYNEGHLAMSDIPNDTKLSTKDEIIYEATINDQVIVSKEHIKHFLNSLNYPLFHFDFETFDNAIPLFDNTRAWQKIPFQFSCHIEQKDGSIERKEFLAEGGVDPRPAILQAMKEVFEGTTGDIIVYYQTFEKGRIQEMIRDFPEHKDWLQNMLDRIVDLYIPFSQFYYYNPTQKGSASIKKVLPAIVPGKSYSQLEIQNGGDASMEYYYSHYKDLEGKEKIRKNLLIYCGLDTESMVWIVEELRKLVK